MSTEVLSDHPLAPSPPPPLWELRGRGGEWERGVKKEGKVEAESVYNG